MKLGHKQIRVVKIDGQKIREAMAMTGFTIRDIARKVHIHESNLCRWINGQGYPKDMKKVAKIAKVLRLKLKEILLPETPVESVK